MKMETKENLVSLFDDIDVFNKEFPVIASCIKEEQENDSVWSNEESLHLVYDKDEECLTVTGILNVIENNGLLAVKVLIENEAGKQWMKMYAPIGETFLEIKEAFEISCQDAYGLTGKLIYLQLQDISKGTQMHGLGATKTMMSVKSSSYKMPNAIYGFENIKLFHPCKSLPNGDEIVIVYGAPGANQYDYNFRNNGNVFIPIAMVLKFESKWNTVESFTVKRVEATNRLQGAIKYNGEQIRLVTGAVWNAMSKSEKEKYPVFGEVKNDEYVILIALDWGHKIAEFNINKSEFLINADFEFRLKNKDNGTTNPQLMLRSVRSPKPYRGGDEYEIPYLCLMNDCVKSDTVVKIKRAGNLQEVKVSEVVPGDYVQTKNQVCEVLYNLMGSTTSFIELQVNGKTLSLTKNHSVCTKQGWIHANELIEQDMIFMEDQKYYKIEKLRCAKEEIFLNSLVLRDEHAYYANGFYVGDHNLVVASRAALKALPMSKELREELVKLKNQFK